MPRFYDTIYVIRLLHPLLWKEQLERGQERYETMVDILSTFEKIELASNEAQLSRKQFANFQMICDFFC